jgi:glucose/arabinose dehydrogenase
MRAIRSRLVPVLLILSVALLVMPTAVGAQAVPPGFVNQLVTDDVESPTALAFFPNGDLLITAKAGQLWFLASGSDTPSLALNLGPVTCTNSERGLLGVAIHPAFSRGQQGLYLYYTARRVDNVCVNRVSRFQFSGAAVVPGTEQILLTNMPSNLGNHNGGDVQFGRDGLLYITVGEGGVPGQAPRRNVLAGKILRITATGGIPPGNPFRGRLGSRCNQTGRTVARRSCLEIYALGLRNPYRIAHDPNSRRVRFFINDVGQGTWEEIDRGIAGANYGWPTREGPCREGTTARNACGRPPRALTNPIHAYRHTSGCRSITGGAFVPASAGWPAVYGGNYLFADFICGIIFQLDSRGNGRFARSIFATNLGGVTHLTFSPGGDLYYTTFVGDGQVRRIVNFP